MSSLKQDTPPTCQPDGFDPTFRIQSLEVQTLTGQEGQIPLHIAWEGQEPWLFWFGRTTNRLVWTTDMGEPQNTNQFERDPREEQETKAALGEVPSILGNTLVEKWARPFLDIAI